MQKLTLINYKFHKKYLQINKILQNIIHYYSRYEAEDVS